MSKGPTYCALYLHTHQQVVMCKLKDLYHNDDTGKLISKVKRSELSNMVQSNESCRWVNDDGQVLDAVGILKFSCKLWKVPRAELFAPFPL